MKYSNTLTVVKTSVYISNTAIKFADLPDFQSRIGDVYRVSKSSGLRITGWDYPAGLYQASENGWVLFSLEINNFNYTNIVKNITSWGDFYDSKPVISLGDRLISNGKWYENTTGLYTNQAPVLDVTNWRLI